MSLDRFRSHPASADYTYISLLAALILLGLVLLSSSSVVLSSELYGSSYSLVTRQVFALMAGLIIALGVAKIHYSFWRRYATSFLLVTLALSLLVFVPGLGETVNGATRWITIGSFQLQPSELLKLSLVIYLAAWFERKGLAITSFSGGFLSFSLLLVAPVVLILLQRDMGTLSIIALTAAAMFALAGARLSHLLLGTVGGIGLFYIFILNTPYRLQRLTVFLNPNADTLGASYHINQSLLAVGSGGLWGRGFGQSLQKYLYLPEPHTDSIFAIAVEELGFFRALGLLILIALLAYRGYQIANRAGDVFGRMVAFGITSWLLFQSLINIASILGLMPLTGLPLPFVSYGGTALVTNLAAAAIVVNISRYGYGK